MIAGINTLVNLQQAAIQPVDLPELAEKKLTIDVLRIDKIHATVSGNKWFKLKYSLQQAMHLNKNTVITFGGAYSNHLVATAYSCARLGLQSIGIVRGEEPANLSPALADCRQWGMQLRFISREMYSHQKNITTELQQDHPDACIIPEGGSNDLGVKGAGEILRIAECSNHSHICCAMGTGTMMAGLVNSAGPHQQVTGISALRLPEGDNSLRQFIEHHTIPKQNYAIHYNYHFGGYARKTPQLLAFMNGFYARTAIPLDFVYTAKLMYGVIDLAGKGYFPEGSRLLVIHSGGLQGNRSLPKNSLVF